MRPLRHSRMALRMFILEEEVVEMSELTDGQSLKRSLIVCKVKSEAVMDAWDKEEGLVPCDSA